MSLYRVDSQGILLVYSTVKGVDFPFLSLEGEVSELPTQLAQLPNLSMLTMTPRLSFLSKNVSRTHKTQQEVLYCYISAGSALLK